MRRFLLALSAFFVVASLQAITINWSIPMSEYAWDATLEFDSIYFVYSETQVTDASKIAGGDYTGYKVGFGTNGGTVVSSVGKDATYGGHASLMVGGTTGTNSGTDTDPGNKAVATLTLSGTGFGVANSGYYYLVVFNPNAGEGGQQYAVSQAIQYTGNSETDHSHGIYDTVMTPDKIDTGLFYDTSWMGGNWTAAITPEPTALALLALGVAGLALRRKI